MKYAILETNHVAYRLALPPSLEGVHDVFHESQHGMSEMRVMYWTITNWNCSQTCLILSN